MRKIVGLLFFSFCLFDSDAQQLSKAENGTFILMDAEIHTVSSGIVQGSLLIRGNEISAIGENVPIPEGATVIDCSGLQVYPGMIDGGTRLGLFEVGSISLTQDYDEIGELTPHVFALTAVNPNSVLIPVTRVNGVTSVLTVPAGGLFPGTAALINLHGYTPDQMYAGFSAVTMNFPSVGRGSGAAEQTDEEIQKQNERSLKDLNSLWDEVKLYQQLKEAAAGGHGEAPGYHPELEALVPVITGESDLLIEVNRDKDIEAAIIWIKEKGIKAIFTGVAEGWRVASKIAEAKIPCIVGPVLNLPTRSSDRYDKPYANAGILANAGVKVAIRTSAAENVRNLPYNAGFAVAYGMKSDDALRAVTIHPAEIFGVSDLYGSLEPGKRVNLFITDGDPFEPATKVHHVFIEGWQIPMDNRQIRLYNEFLERTPGAKK